MKLNFTYDNQMESILASFNKIYEADEELPEVEPSDDVGVDDGKDESNIEIAPPPEGSEIKNSDTFIEGKVSNLSIGNDPSVHNLTTIISADMQDQDKLKNYVKVFFTRLGINDVDPERFKMFSSEIWKKLEDLTQLDPKTALAEFSTWTLDKIGQYNR